MMDISDYVVVDCVGEHELGFALSAENTGFSILVLAFNHQSCSVDVAGIAQTVEEAFEIYFDSIRKLSNAVS